MQGKIKPLRLKEEGWGGGWVKVLKAKEMVKLKSDERTKKS